MNDFNPELSIERAFKRVRKEFGLGMREYLAALDAAKGGWGKTRDELAQVLKLLWCHSPAQQIQFAMIWDTLKPEPVKPNNQKSEKRPASDLKSQPSSPSQVSNPTPVKQTELRPISTQQETLKPLPVQAPFIPAEIDEATELSSFSLITRRSMAYSWRYLRRPLADGPKDVFDLEATISETTKQGFYYAPTYRRREVNHAHLILLIDQDGSMTPFHRFSRDLVETAKYDNTLKYDSTLEAEPLDVFYFHNIPVDYVYQDDHLTTPVPWSQVLARCDLNTSVVIVSDAGAARGYRRMERLRATTQFLASLKQKTRLIGWLNPMPKKRWESSSAELIAYLVAMEQMDEDGLHNIIDIVRDQSKKVGVS